MNIKQFTECLADMIDAIPAIDLSDELPLDDFDAAPLFYIAASIERYANIDSDDYDTYADIDDLTRADAALIIFDAIAQIDA